MVYTLKEIAEIVNGQLIGESKTTIEFLLYDSRRVIPSERSLFFALKGKRDGHWFVEDMIKKGVNNFVVSRKSDRWRGNFIVVKDTLRALQKLARYHRRKFSLPVVGITGSNGKTVVKEWLSYFLERFFRVVKSPKSFNSQIGVALSLWEIEEQSQIAIIEAGISEPGEMKYLEAMIQPNMGIFTNLGDAHQQNFLSVEQKLNEKLLLFKSVEKIYFCADNELVYTRIQEKFSNKKLIFWSKKYVDSTLFIKSINRGVQTIINGVYKGEKVHITIPYSDDASIENSIIVWLFLLDNLGVGSVKKLNFSELPQIEMRLQQIRGINNSVIINDSYNYDFTSLRIALDYFCSQSLRREKIIILSDIEQTDSSEEIYQRLASLLKKTQIETIVCIGEQISKYARFFDFPKRYFFSNTDEFIRFLPSFNVKDKIILLKGARKFKFERISQFLEQKSHRTVFEINLNSIKHNLDYFRSLLNRDTKIMVMVKAFSYGSGSYEIASFLESENIDYLGVAIVDEGIELRQAGIGLPIVVMNPDIYNLENIINYDLEPEIYNFRLLESFYKHSKKNGYYPLPVHIKINTGMNRLGFEISELPELLSKLYEYSDGIRVKSVFSHLVGSSEKEFDDFTRNQIKMFEKVAEEFKKHFGKSVIAHILNSGGIERFAYAQMDMVRLGIGLYGISAIDNSRLKQIGTLKTRILQIRKVKKGASIGYSRAQYVKRDSIIATLPIGYADGLNRKLSNGVGKVLVKGHLAPIVGNICMDLTMIDITDIPNVSIDDEVIIFGEDLPVNQIAEWINTIPYEVLTSVSHRVKRVYLWE